MKGTLSESARAILDDPKATNELFDFLVSGADAKRQPRQIAVEGHVFEVSSGVSVSSAVAGKKK